MRHVAAICLRVSQHRGLQFIESMTEEYTCAVCTTLVEEPTCQNTQEHHSPSPASHRIPQACLSSPKTAIQTEAVILTKCRNSMEKGTQPNIVISLQTITVQSQNPLPVNVSKPQPQPQPRPRPRSVLPNNCATISPALNNQIDITTSTTPIMRYIPSVSSLVAQPMLSKDMQKHQMS